MEDETELRECMYLCSAVERLESGGIRHILDFCYKRKCECIAKKTDCNLYKKETELTYNE